MITSTPGSAEVITVGPLRAAGATVAGDIDELDTTLVRVPRGREAAALIESTTVGTAERQMPVRIGYALAMAAATGAPVRVAGQLMDQFAVAARDDLVGQFTRNSPLPQPTRC